MPFRDLSQLVALAALWGASFLLIRIASAVLTPPVLAMLRIGLAVLTLGVLMLALRQRWPPRREWAALALVGFFSIALPFLLFAWAGLHLPAGYSAVLNSTSILFAALTSAWLGQDRLTPRKLAGCALGMAGVALVVRLGPVALTPTVLLAAAACVGAAFCYGIATPLMKRVTERMEPLTIAFGISLAAWLMLLAPAVATWPQARFTPGALAAVAVMGVLTSGLAYWWMVRLVRRLSPLQAMAPSFMVPLFGVAWGAIFLHEPLNPMMAAGGALILLAVALVTGFTPWRRLP